MDEIEIIVSVTWFSFIILMVYVNYITISIGQTVNHDQNALITGLCGASLTLFWKWNITDMVYVYSILLFTYWLLFDIMLNFSLGWNIEYLGETSVLDRFLKKYVHGQAILFKIFCIALSTLIYSLL
jgi:hypothetical protein